MVHITEKCAETTHRKGGEVLSGIFFFWAGSSNHCLAALDLGAGVEQPFDCLIVQNRQAVQSMRTLMDGTLEDNMVHGLF